MHIFKFNFKLFVLKNLIYLAYQIFTNFIETNANAGLATGMNYLKLLLEMYKY